MRRALLAWFLAMALAGCTGLFFQPMKRLVRTPADLGLAYEDVNLVSTDKVALHAWFLPARNPRGTVLFLHGNAENISTHIGSVFWLPEHGYQVLLLDYRGYGRSAGTPTMDGVQRDIDAAMRHLLSRPDVDPGRLVLFGQSLGGALAVYYAAHGPERRKLRAIVVDSAPSGFRDIAREKLDILWWTRWLKWPAGFTIDDSFSPLGAVGEIDAIPKLFLAGGKDVIVPPHHGKRLFDAARAPKTLWNFPDAGHIAALSQPEARIRFLEWLGQSLGDGNAGGAEEAGDASTGIRDK
ncbi:MAG: alpha/beta hydrolase [Betaproteobacteria bacterium]|nr:alpha/beta hydrolase [Betaproteobacteria bacterium]